MRQLLGRCCALTPFLKIQKAQPFKATRQISGCSLGSLVYSSILPPGTCSLWAPCPTADPCHPCDCLLQGKVQFCRGRSSRAAGPSPARPHPRWTVGRQESFGVFSPQPSPSKCIFAGVPFLRPSNRGDSSLWPLRILEQQPASRMWTRASEDTWSHASALPTMTWDLS